MHQITFLFVRKPRKNEFNDFESQVSLSDSIKGKILNLIVFIIRSCSYLNINIFSSSVHLSLFDEIIVYDKY